MKLLSVSIYAGRALNPPKSHLDWLSRAESFLRKTVRLISINFHISLIRLPKSKLIQGLRSVDLRNWGILIIGLLSAVCSSDDTLSALSKLIAGIDFGAQNLWQHVNSCLCFFSSHRKRISTKRIAVTRYTNKWSGSPIVNSPWLTSIRHNRPQISRKPYRIIVSIH